MAKEILQLRVTGIPMPSQLFFTFRALRAISILPEITVLTMQLKSEQFCDVATMHPKRFRVSYPVSQFEVSCRQRPHDLTPFLLNYTLAGFSGGLRRVAGSLAVTRALGDAYLKTPLLSFPPYKRHAPYITARPEVNCRLLPKGGGEMTSNMLVLATDGVWERNDGHDVLRWIRNHTAECASQEQRKANRVEGSAITADTLSPESTQVENAADWKKRKFRPRRRLGLLENVGPQSNVSEVVVRRVLHKVCRSRKMSMRDLLALPKGRARRSRHDDITVCVVDLAAFLA